MLVGFLPKANYRGDSHQYVQKFKKQEKGTLLRLPCVHSIIIAPMRGKNAEIGCQDTHYVN